MGKIKVVFWRSEVPERLRLSDRVSWLPVGVRVGRIVTAGRFRQCVPSCCPADVSCGVFVGCSSCIVSPGVWRRRCSVVAPCRTNCRRADRVIRWTAEAVRSVACGRCRAWESRDTGRIWDKI